MKGLDLVKQVTCGKQYKWHDNNIELNSHSNNYKIAVIDFGVKNNILRQLSLFKCDITVFPAHSTAKEILSIEGKDFLSSVGLDRAISSQRTNGFSNAINKIQKELLT